jgi:hypothetical protein
MPEQRVLKLRSQLNAVLSELIVKGDLVKLNWSICVIRELSLCCRLSVLLKISRGFGIKRPLLGLLLGAISLNLRRQSKNYSSIGHLLTRKLECTIDSNSRLLLAPKINSKISAALEGAVQTREVFASYSYYFGRIYLAIA